MTDQDDDLRKLLRGLFEVCEDTENFEPKNDFERGRVFEAKRIRRGIGTWFQDEFCGRAHMGEPVKPPPDGADVAKALHGLHNLKVLLGTDAPEVRGWAPAVQQAAQKALNTAIRALNDSSGGPPPGSREAAMIVLERNDSGTPTVWCDPDIADLVGALNRAGIRTIASCSGHGERDGSILLKDGRELVIRTPGVKGRTE